jgi:hypothetical protein
MLPLNSIPTEIIRKSFVPYRGFITKVLIDLPPEEEPLRGAIGQRDPLSGAKAADLALSVTPIYKVFADLFGYDPDLLQAGNGDCGVTGHDWNIYGQKERVPQVIRWRGFDGGEALLCLGATHHNYYVMVAGVANKQMAPKLSQVFEAIGELRNEKQEETLDQPMGNLLQQVITEADVAYREITAGYWCATHEGEPDEQQKAELQKLRFSCRFHPDFAGGMHKYSVPRRRLRDLKNQQQPGQRVIMPQVDSRIPLLFSKDEPLPEAIIEQIYANSVEDAEKAMQAVMSPAFESRTERLQEYLHDEGLAVTTGDDSENERAYALAFIMKTAERGLMQSLNDDVKKISFSREFRSTPPKSLLGTQPANQLYDGHVIPSRDLIREVTRGAIDHADRMINNLDVIFKLLGVVIPSDDVAMRQDRNPMLAKLVVLEKPYTALYRGLPVRVTESMMARRADDSEGLAADFYIDRQNQALHFVALYRVPARKS